MLKWYFDWPNRCEGAFHCDEKYNQFESTCNVIQGDKHIEIKNKIHVKCG